MTPAPRRRPKPYHWFEDAAESHPVSDLYNQIEQYGVANVRLEVHTEGLHMYFRVIDKTTGRALPNVNNSHICPPDCGGGG